MYFVVIVLKTNMSTNQDYYSQELTAQCMKSKLKMFKTDLVRIKN